MTTMDDIEARLEDVMARAAGDAEPLAEVIRELKAASVAAGDQAAAKRLWCLEETLDVQTTYLRAFELLKAGSYYSAWCKLEDAELGLLRLEKHQSFDRFQLAFISDAVRRFQRLFPYKMFVSPEFVKLEKRCSICDEVVTIRKPCGHRVGEIYDGEICGRVVTKVKAIGLAMVERPLQKYSVMFLSDPRGGASIDHYDYAVVKYLIERLASPFDGWDFAWTKRRHSHSRFRDVGRNRPCPCESGKKYKRCCLSEDGVLRPHCQFTFDSPPVPESLTTVYSY